jgi:hypothetical protein
MNPLLIIHVVISLVGIASGLVVLAGMLAGKRLNGITLVFLVTTVATSLTGFLLPLNGFTPAVGVAIVSLPVLALACLARYAYNLQGAWRTVYVVSASVALYFNVFVLVVQLFQKVASLKALAPTQTEPAFLIAQASTLGLFVVLGIAAVLRFHPESSQTMRD